MKNWDYRSPVPYFITIKTRNRKPLFGYIENKIMNLNDLGKFADQCMKDIPDIFESVMVTNHIIMPDHVHAIIELTGAVDRHEPNRFGPLKKGSLSSIINHFKGKVTKYAKENQFDWGWQTLYYDRIIRDPAAYRNIYDYISNNPAKWKGRRGKG